MKHFDKSTVRDIIAKFYHEDELYDAKSELCKVVAAAQPDAMPPDGWAKFVNSKGVPVNRRMSDAALMLLDVNKVILPKFVFADPDRVPNCVGCNLIWFVRNWYADVSCTRYRLAVYDYDEHCHATTW